MEFSNISPRKVVKVKKPNSNSDKNSVNASTRFDSLDNDVNLENFISKTLDDFQKTLKFEPIYLKYVENWNKNAIEIDKIHNFPK